MSEEEETRQRMAGPHANANAKEVTANGGEEEVVIVEEEEDVVVVGKAPPVGRNKKPHTAFERWWSPLSYLLYLWFAPLLKLVRADCRLLVCVAAEPWWLLKLGSSREGGRGRLGRRRRRRKRIRTMDNVCDSCVAGFMCRDIKGRWNMMICLTRQML